jgi:hypothetical protein
MCPACMASIGLIAGSVMSTGAFAALVVKFRSRIAAHKFLTKVEVKEKNP